MAVAAAGWTPGLTPTAAREVAEVAEVAELAELGRAAPVAAAGLSSRMPAVGLEAAGSGVRSTVEAVGPAVADGAVPVMTDPPVHPASRAAPAAVAAAAANSEVRERTSSPCATGHAPGV